MVKHNDSPPKREKVQFHQAQLDFLEELYPERVFPPDTPENVLRDYNGKRSVVLAVKARVKTFSAA